MLREAAKPVTFIFCILSLYAVFHAAFLNPAADFEQRIWESLGLLALAAGISVVSALFFREAAQKPLTGAMRLTATLPVRMFCWASGVMFVLFVVAWYLETHCKFYRDVRFY